MKRLATAASALVILLAGCDSSSPSTPQEPQLLPDLEVTSHTVSQRGQGLGPRQDYCIQNVGTASSGPYNINQGPISTPRNDWGGGYGYASLEPGQEYCGYVGYVARLGGTINDGRPFGVYVDLQEQIEELEEGNNFSVAKLR